MLPNCTLCNLVRYAVLRCNLSSIYDIYKLLIYIRAIAMLRHIITFSLLLLPQYLHLSIGDYLAKGVIENRQISHRITKNREKRLHKGSIRCHKGVIKIKKVTSKGYINYLDIASKIFGLMPEPSGGT